MDRFIIVAESGGAVVRGPVFWDETGSPFGPWVFAWTSCGLLVSRPGGGGEPGWMRARGSGGRWRDAVFGSDMGCPIHLLGTAFQIAVWRSLLAIPAGETRTYAEVARAVGRLGSARAVGNAVGANRLAVAVPCHRVVRTGGGLGGYRWGVSLKVALLKRESA